MAFWEPAPRVLGGVPAQQKISGVGTGVGRIEKGLLGEWLFQDLKS